MLVKANNSFTGQSINMTVGEVREITDKVILDDLLQAGHVEEVKQKKPKKAVKENESK